VRKAPVKKMNSKEDHDDEKKHEININLDPMADIVALMNRMGVQKEVLKDDSPKVVGAENILLQKRKTINTSLVDDEDEQIADVLRL